jgi:HEAT repeat protein
MAVHRIVRNAHPLDTNDWMTPLYEISDRLELEHPPLLLGSNEAKMPFACGFMRPTIVLPADAENWTADRRHAVLLHELAHVKRRDLVGHTLGRIACAVYWFHPLVWTAAKQLRNESERACDDLALSCGARASDYAEHLLDIVTSVRHDSTPAVALAMARRKEFEGRMLAILDPELRHSTPSRLQSMALIGSLAVIAVVVGAAAPAHRTAPNVALMSSTAAQNPEYDKDFTPRDIEDAEKDRVRGKALDKAIDKAVNKSVNESVNRATQGVLSESIANAVTNSVSHSVTRSVTNSVNRTVNRSVNNSIESIGNDFGKAVGKSVLNSLGQIVGATIGSVGANASAEAVAEAKAEAIADAKADAKAEAEADGPSIAALERLRGRTNGRLQIAKPDERPVLLAKILRTEADPQLRRIAAWGLSEYAGNSVAGDALIEALRRDTDASVREMSAWALGDGDARSSAAGALSVALRSDANEKVRATSAWALGHIENREGLAALTAALNDASLSVRTRALWAIGQLEPREVPTAVVDRLRDPSDRVRELAAWVLFQSEDPATIPALNAALKAEKNPSLQMAYIRALSALGEKSVDAISGLLTSSDPKVKQMAIRALAGGRGAGPWPWPWPEPRPYP